MIDPEQINALDIWRLWWHVDLGLFEKALKPDIKAACEFFHVREI